MISTVIYFILALLLLVIFHELGHFLAARLLGVKVLRFSFGFGKVLASWTDKRGTEYTWSAIPLGGYVKMLDENESSVLASEQHAAFNYKPIWIRAVIVLAGPGFSFLFAFIVLWLSAMLGVYTLAPVIGTVTPGSVAAQAGVKPKDEVIQVNHKLIHNWRDFQFAFVPYIGSQEPITLIVKSAHNQKHRIIHFQLPIFNFKNNKQDILDEAGIGPYLPKISPVVDAVIKDSAAEQAGFKKGDKLIALNGQPYDDWITIVKYIQKHPGKMIAITIKRDEKQLILYAAPKPVSSSLGVQGFLGLQSKPPQGAKGWLRFERQGPLQAISFAWDKTIQYIDATFTLIVRFFTGNIPLKAMSGPLGIAEGAGESGRSGITGYLSFLAIISISVGVLNLLPIPLLDGGHLLYYLIEAIIRRPLPQSMQNTGKYAGFLLLLFITITAFNNDIARLLGP